jgi:biopolymer transport protein ExbB/TolQ
VADEQRPFGGGAKVWRTGADVVVRLPLALAVIYIVAIIIWYELIRLAVMTQVAKRRSGRAERDEFEQWRSQEAELEESRRQAAEQEAAEESEPDPARRYYYIARRTARAERDAAVEAASKAVEQAIERIERRHLKIEAALDHEERVRITREFGPETETD